MNKQRRKPRKVLNKIVMMKYSLKGVCIKTIIMPSRMIVMILRATILLDRSTSSLSDLAVK